MNCHIIYELPPRVGLHGIDDIMPPLMPLNRRIKDSVQKLPGRNKQKLVDQIQHFEPRHHQYDSVI